MNRRALQAATVSRQIFEAWSDEPWVIDGAAVRVSLVCFSRAGDEAVSGARLDGSPSMRSTPTYRHGAAAPPSTSPRSDVFRRTPALPSWASRKAVPSTFQIPAGEPRGAQAP